MKKLKFRCPFRGYDNYVALALFFTILATIMLNNKQGSSIDIFMFILLIIAHNIDNRFCYNGSTIYFKFS